MRVPITYAQQCKTVAHVIQIIFIFLSACLGIAVLTKAGHTDGRNGWFLALCFLSIPALVYLMMVPMWERAARFANAYAFLALDVLYTIFWLSAIIAMATFNSSGIKQGEIDRKIAKGTGNCTTSAYGSEGKCKLINACVGLGVIILIAFLLTSALSFYFFMQFRKTGEMSHIKKPKNQGGLEGLDGQKDAWDADTHDIGRPEHYDNVQDHDHHDEEHYDHYDHNDHHDSQPQGHYGRDDDEYALLHSTEANDGQHPGRPVNWGNGQNGSYQDMNQDTSYGGASHGGHSDPNNALSPGGYKGNYSFSGGDR